MFLENAIQFWRFRTRQEHPDEAAFIGAFPEDEPKNWVFQMTWGDNITYVVVTPTDQLLATREADEKEVNFLINGLSEED